MATVPQGGRHRLAPAGFDPEARPRISILNVEAPEGRHQAEHRYRTLQPCRALGELGNVSVVSGSLLSPTVHALLLRADVLVVGDQIDPDLLPIFDSRRRARRLSVYEINHHHLFPPPESAPSPVDLVRRSLSPQLARQSDCLQFPTQELERRFHLVNQRRAVFPSHRWTPTAETAREPPGPRVRIGWGGAIGHIEDLRFIAPALLRTAARHPEVDIAILGHERLRALFADLPPERFAFTPESSFEANEAFVGGLTIGVSPLLPTTFNRCRSDSKFLEYAAHRVLAVCSDLEPYAAVRERNLGLMFRSPDELEAVLTEAISAPDRRRELVERAARFVDSERMERPNAPQRLGAYLGTMANLGLAPESMRDPSLPPLFQDLHQTPAFAGSRYVAIEEDSVESRLALGLAAERAGHRDEALRRFDEASARAPTFYLPWLLAALAEPAPRAALERLRRASELAPRSCRTLYEMGVRLAALGDEEAARTAWERCRILAPAFGAAEARLAELADSHGHIEEACRRFEEAALQNSFLAWPVARLASIALEGGQLEKAAALLRPSLEHDGELWLTNFLIGRAYEEMRRFDEARIHLTRALESPIGSAHDRAAVLALLASVELRLGARDATRARLDELRRHDKEPEPR
jgi:tetratricopeptide (TPR) repeat protein